MTQPPVRRVVYEVAPRLTQRGAKAGAPGAARPTARPARPAPLPPPPPPEPALPPPPNAAKMELVIKFTEMPTEVSTERNGWKTFTLLCGGRVVRTSIRPRYWLKLEQAARDWPQWVASLGGSMGPPIQGTGFQLLEPTLQLFEKKAKEPKPPAPPPDPAAAPPANGDPAAAPPAPEGAQVAAASPPEPPVTAPAAPPAAPEPPAAASLPAEPVEKG